MPSTPCIAAHSVSTVRAPRGCNAPFTFENAPLIGLGPGEYGGRNRNPAPAAPISPRARWTLVAAEVVQDHDVALAQRRARHPRQPFEGDARPPQRPADRRQARRDPEPASQLGWRRVGLLAHRSGQAGPVECPRPADAAGAGPRLAGLTPALFEPPDPGAADVEPLGNTLGRLPGVARGQRPIAQLLRIAPPVGKLPPKRSEALGIKFSRSRSGSGVPDQKPDSTRRCKAAPSISETAIGLVPPAPHSPRSPRFAPARCSPRPGAGTARRGCGRRSMARCRPSAGSAKPAPPRSRPRRSAG